MSFPDKHPEVLYIIISIKLHIGDDMDKSHDVCDVLDYNTGTWWNYNDETITQYPGYPPNVYNDLSNSKKQKKRKKCVWMDQIGLYPGYIVKNTFLHRALIILLQGSKYQKRWKY